MLKVVVSACLLGSPVRFDGRDKYCAHPILQRWIDEGRVISACPEVLGGLGTPRPPAEIVNDGSRRVITNEGDDVTREFHAGAVATANAAATHNARIAILKSGSPSCGSAFIYDGTFSKTRVAGEGIATAMLRSQGVAVFSEDELDAAEAYLTSLENQLS
jgi:uncharacterized protein YbbK (DUF523 family)